MSDISIEESFFPPVSPVSGEATRELASGLTHRGEGTSVLFEKKGG